MSEPSEAEIEAAAKPICEWVYGYWDQTEEAEQASCLELARAALTAASIARQALQEQSDE